MTHTVVAIFDNETTAQSAARRLIDTGVPPNHIDLANSSVRTSDKNAAEDEEEGFFTRVGNFFRSLFDEETQAEKYSEFARNRTVVTVHAQSGEEAAHAAQILDEGGAMDANSNFSGRSRTTEADYVSDQALPINDERLDEADTIGAGGLRTRSRIFNRPVYKDYRLFGMNFYYDEDDLDHDNRLRGRNY